MDKSALEHELVRRLLKHVEHRTTDMADEVLELPTSIYSAERHADEVDALFLGLPIVLCLSGAVTAPGSSQNLELCGTALRLTRDAEGVVHAVDIRRPGAEELPVAEGNGLIVGRLRPGPPIDVEEFLGPDLAEELTALDFSGWIPSADPHVHRIDANWKVTLDTFRENYHFNYLHRTTLAGYAYGAVLTFDPFGRHLRNSSALRSIDELRTAPEAQWGDVSGHLSLQYAIFPNTSLAFDSRHAELWQILPVSVDTSVALHTAYIRPDLNDEERTTLTEMLPWICEAVVDAEDFWVAGRTEPGLRCGLLDTIVFGRNEPAPQHLHRGFDAALAAASSGS